MEVVGLFLSGVFLMYLGLAVFIFIWWKCCGWLFVWFVTVSEKYFKKDSWQEKLFLGTFVGVGGIFSIYLFIWLFVYIAKENGY